MPDPPSPDALHSFLCSMAQEYRKLLVEKDEEIQRLDVMVTQFKSAFDDMVCVCARTHTCV